MSLVNCFAFSSFLVPPGCQACPGLCLAIEGGGALIGTPQHSDSGSVQPKSDTDPGPNSFHAKKINSPKTGGNGGQHPSTTIPQPTAPQKMPLPPKGGGGGRAPQTAHFLAQPTHPLSDPTPLGVDGPLSTGLITTRPRALAAGPRTCTDMLATC